jgi:ABC-type dipeptide/oligopeptide/nickel transport system ATPase component
MNEKITNFIEEIKKCDSLAIIGLSKNAGKTTTLNSILKLLDYKDVMLTSIGYDGEDTDLIFGTAKPTIFVKAGTVVATAKKCVLNSDIQFEILETTGFNTPLGEIIIVRCLEQGLLELAGPAYNSQLREVIHLLKEFGSGLVIVDGALNRKSFSDPSVCDKTILCSGMVLSNDINQVAKQTLYTVELLTLPQVKKDDLELVSEMFENPISIINDDKSYDLLDIAISINQESLVIKKLDKNSRYLVINGPFTEKLALHLIKSRSLFEGLAVVVQNGTKIFIKEATYEQLKLAKIELRVIDEISICAISMSPSNLYKEFDSEELVNKVASQTEIFVHDFVGGK